MIQTWLGRDEAVVRKCAVVRDNGAGRETGVTTQRIQREITPATRRRHDQ